MSRCTMTRSPTIVATFFLCVYITASATPTTTIPTTTITAHTNGSHSTNNSSNYNCPEDCQCTINVHKSLLHAKCSSIQGLKSDVPLQAALPIHSIDLSYLSLTRLAHSLDKLRDLTSIDLSHNELHEIGHLGRRIKKLNLKHNRITSLKLTKLPQHVQLLNLQHNDITYLPLELTKLTHLQTLELAHNQINCSCETLEVRNWLQQRHVFMEHPVKCSFPTEVSGKSWLQVKQSDVCAKEKEGLAANLVVDNNDVMMGDQPIEGSDDNEDEDELGKAYLPINHKSRRSHKSEEIIPNDVEGSGDLSEMNLPLKMSPVTRSTTQNTDSQFSSDAADTADDEGSGSGGGAFFIPHIIGDPHEIDDFDTTDLHKHNANDDADKKPLPAPAQEATPSPDVFGTGMGIYNDADTISTLSPVVEDDIVPKVHHQVNAPNAPDKEVVTDGPVDGDPKAAILASVDHDDSNATYFLLGVIVLIVVGLILYVGIKRCKYNQNRSRDVENQRQTELLDMDKKHPGKPKQQRNGLENAPLIGEQTKSDLAKAINGANKKAYEAGDIQDGPAKEQLLQKENANGHTNGNAPAEQLTPANNELSPHEYCPITPRYPTPKSPRASKYAQQPNGTEPNNNNNNNDNADAYRAASPTAGRYSPVYSPETGRVKIKLTETPKPKTPMLVTRSKSNAGDIITTPVHLGTLDTPAVYVTPAGGANGYVDGH